MKLITLNPTLNWSSEQAAIRYAGRFLTCDDYDQLVAEDSRGVLSSGETKFLFLTGLIPPRRCEEIFSALRQLPYIPVSGSHRKALRGSPAGGHMVMGFIRDKISRCPRYTAPTEQHPRVYRETVVPLVNFVNGVVKKPLPQYWREQARVARRNGDCRIGRSIFSTVTLNRTVWFPSHSDDNHGRVTCLMAFGTFANGYLCFPRFRVAFRLAPGDLLIADFNHEQHGNIGPLAGERISFVCYLKDLSND